MKVDENFHGGLRLNSEETYEAIYQSPSNENKVCSFNFGEKNELSKTINDLILNFENIKLNSINDLEKSLNSSYSVHNTINNNKPLEKILEQEIQKVKEEKEKEEKDVFIISFFKNIFGSKENEEEKKKKHNMKKVNEISLLNPPYALTPPFFYSFTIYITIPNDINMEETIQLKITNSMKIRDIYNEVKKRYSNYFKLNIETFFLKDEVFSINDLKENKVKQKDLKKFENKILEKIFNLCKDCFFYVKIHKTDIYDIKLFEKFSSNQEI